MLVGKSLMLHPAAQFPPKQLLPPTDLVVAVLNALENPPFSCSPEAARASNLEMSNFFFILMIFDGY